MEEPYPSHLLFHHLLHVTSTFVHHARHQNHLEDLRAQEDLHHHDHAAAQSLINEAKIPTRPPSPFPISPSSLHHPNQTLSRPPNLSDHRA